ncbi:MAG: response regulator transcription factor [Eubacteriaceae bacterium]|nr:response regulator transcription factor [Eubacteriaceae bacterium]
MYKIFIVEDDKGIADSITKEGALWDIECRACSNFRHIMSEFAEFDPHLVLLDISLPFYNGYHWCQEIRKVSKVPVIFISSASDNLNIVMAMNMGADDFISKPFDMSVLIAKVQAMLRRTYDFGSRVSVLEHKGALLNTADGSFIYKDENISLTKNEYRILLTLMVSKGKVVSREKLMEALWKTDEFVDENTLTVNVNRLRKKLQNAGLEGFIETKHGVGYIVE